MPGPNGTGPSTALGSTYFLNNVFRLASAQDDGGRMTESKSWAFFLGFAEMF